MIYADAHAYGIYAIVNKLNGKYYIGRTETSFENRWRLHVATLDNGNHHNRQLQVDWQEYGKSAFQFEILEVITDRNMIVKREEYYLKSTNYSLYNVAGSGGKRLKNRPVLPLEWDSLTELLTTDEVATILKVSDQTIVNLCKEKKIPSLKVGKQYRIRKDVIEEMLKTASGDKERPSE